MTNSIRFDIFCFVLPSLTERSRWRPQGGGRGQAYGGGGGGGYGGGGYDY